MVIKDKGHAGSARLHHLAGCQSWLAPSRLGAGQLLGSIYTSFHVVPQLTVVVKNQSYGYSAVLSSAQNIFTVQLE